MRQGLLVVARHLERRSQRSVTIWCFQKCLFKSLLLSKRCGIATRRRFCKSLSRFSRSSLCRCHSSTCVIRFVFSYNRSDAQCNNDAQEPSYETTFNSLNGRKESDQYNQNIRLQCLKFAIVRSLSLSSLSFFRSRLASLAAQRARATDARFRERHSRALSRQARRRARAVRALGESRQ